MDFQEDIIPGENNIEVIVEAVHVNIEEDEGRQSNMRNNKDSNVNNSDVKKLVKERIKAAIKDSGGEEHVLERRKSLGKVKFNNNLRKPNVLKIKKDEIDPYLSPEKEDKVATNPVKLPTHINNNNINNANSNVEFANPDLVKIDLNITENMAKMILDHKKN